jgi:hypothetical protein
MKLSYQSLRLSAAVLVVCSGCAHNVVDDMTVHLAAAAVDATACDKSANERVYRNPFLRGRSISQQACAE